MIEQESLLIRPSHGQGSGIERQCRRSGIGLFDPDPRRSGRRRDDAHFAGLSGRPRDAAQRGDRPGESRGRFQGQRQARDVASLVARKNVGCGPRRTGNLLTRAAPHGSAHRRHLMRTFPTRAAYGLETFDLTAPSESSTRIWAIGRLRNIGEWIAALRLRLSFGGIRETNDA